MVYYSDFEKNGNDSQLAVVYSNSETIYSKLLKIKSYMLRDVPQGIVTTK